MESRSTTVLIVLDGWGHRAAAADNAIALARAPVWQRLWREAPHALLSTSGTDVGLPAGQMGNSEVGHMNLGAGRVVYQELTRIDKAIADGDFARNAVIVEALAAIQARGGALHVLGLLSPGGVHSHEDHIAALLELAAARGVARIHVHAFLDGRDTPPHSAAASLARFEALFARLGRGGIASLCGRYFAMDRDQRYERVQPAFDLLTRGEAAFRAGSASAALAAAYARGESDEFVQPTLVAREGDRGVHIGDGDGVVFMNFRADRARQLTRAFVDDAFDGFPRRSRPRLAVFACLTQYAAGIAAPVAFPPQDLANSIGEHLARLGRRQLRLAETEKYAHVTFFFNGGREAPFDGEERVLVPSPKVATYDLEPAMSAVAVTDALVAAIEGRRYDFIVCNYANGDMVGHTGNLPAAIRAVEVIDACLGRVLAVVHASGAQCLITADHGNVERMQDADSGQPHTAHTTEPVPIVYAGPRPLQLSDGVLADVAPTLLTLMELPIPAEMTGRVLCAPVPARRHA
jgi:2,3-bisphosphoglycerate-independent phosphoglycerate mutase